MRLESISPQTPRETEIRRRAHAQAVLQGKTMRQAVYEALELWLEKEEQRESTRRD
jgi:hypothetical protein